MKPLKLTMSAFGSYADLQTIDFAQLGTNGLYLITGETGSGKTTIFDAISYALFGKASGSGRDDYGMLRSDFAAGKTKTYVELDFVSGDNQYKIRRTIRKTGQEVVLILPDGTSMSGDRNIKPKVAEIVGLERDQFAQIVMIAQNDFLRFLQSGTDERLKILRHIFGTGALKQFQERLKMHVKRENDKRALILHDFERYEVDVYKRDEQFGQWETQIQTDKTRLAEVVKQLDLYDKQKQQLAADLAVAEEFCKKFNDLTAFRLAQEAHRAKFDEIMVLKSRAARGEISLRKVKPLADEAQKAWQNHSTAQVDLTSAKEQEIAAKTELAEAIKVIKALPPLANAQEEFAALLNKWETATKKLSQMMVLQVNRGEIADKRDALTKSKAELTMLIDALSKLPAIAEYQSELDKVTADLQYHEGKQSELSILRSNYAVITNKQTDLQKVQAEFEARSLDFKAADEEYRITDEAFFRSQAGIIASSLADHEPCPVCGSPDHPAPAKFSDNDVTEAKLKKAREAKDEAQSKRGSKATECGVLTAEVKTLTRRFIADLSAIAPDTSIEAADALLAEITAATESAIAEFSEKKSVTEKSLTDLKTKFANMTNKRDELTPVIASLQSEIDTLTRRFISDFSEYVPKAEWENSEAELAQLLSQTQRSADELTAYKNLEKEKIDELAANWIAADERRVNAEVAANSARTLVLERASNEQKLLTRCTEAQSAYHIILQENNFADEGEYQDALITEIELAKLSRQVTDYENDSEQLARDIIRLERETADKEKPDIEGLRAETEAVHTASTAFGEERDKTNNRLTKTADALKELRRAAVNFEKTESAYAAVKQLADTANGKLDFETYAQMAYFERVIRAANLRLRLMSQNRFTLLRKTESDDGRRRSGLELEVLDAYTGKARLAGSLSGGESFMASLSLALGLSDIVQQSAGGIHLDAMFIDEGFGSLDAEVLELAIRTLSEMAGTNRIIGIISHVTELRERIDKQIQVEKTTAGSKISLMI